MTGTKYGFAFQSMSGYWIREPTPRLYTSSLPESRAHSPQNFDHRCKTAFATVNDALAVQHGELPCSLGERSLQEAPLPQHRLVRRLYLGLTGVLVDIRSEQALFD